MGSITSRPKAPSVPQPQIIYVPAAAPVSAPPPVATTGSSATQTETDTPAGGTDTPTPEEEQAGQRVESLLQRRRGRFGTILTGFRGILSPSDAMPQRKTLLGE